MGMVVSGTDGSGRGSEQGMNSLIRKHSLWCSIGPKDTSYHNEQDLTQTFGMTVILDKQDISMTALPSSLISLLIYQRIMVKQGITRWGRKIYNYYILTSSRLSIFNSSGRLYLIIMSFSSLFRFPHILLLPLFPYPIDIIQHLTSTQILQLPRALFSPFLCASPTSD